MYSGSDAQSITPFKQRLIDYLQLHREAISQGQVTLYDALHTFANREENKQVAVSFWRGNITRSDGEAILRQFLPNSFFVYFNTYNNQDPLLHHINKTKKATVIPMLNRELAELLISLINQEADVVPESEKVNHWVTIYDYVCSADRSLDFKNKVLKSPYKDKNDKKILAILDTIERIRDERMPLSDKKLKPYLKRFRERYSTFIQDYVSTEYMLHRIFNHKHISKETFRIYHASLKHLLLTTISLYARAQGLKEQAALSAVSGAQHSSSSSTMPTPSPAGASTSTTLSPAVLIAYRKFINKVDMSYSPGEASLQQHDAELLFIDKRLLDDFFRENADNLVLFQSYFKGMDSEAMLSWLPNQLNYFLCSRFPDLALLIEQVQLTDIPCVSTLASTSTPPIPEALTISALINTAPISDSSHTSTTESAETSHTSPESSSPSDSSTTDTTEESHTVSTTSTSKRSSRRHHVKSDHTLSTSTPPLVLNELTSRVHTPPPYHLDCIHPQGDSLLTSSLADMSSSTGSVDDMTPPPIRRGAETRMSDSRSRMSRVHSSLFASMSLSPREQQTPSTSSSIMPPPSGVKSPTTPRFPFLGRRRSVDAGTSSMVSKPSTQPALSSSTPKTPKTPKSPG